jgi:hypothetical protein
MKESKFTKRTCEGLESLGAMILPVVANAKMPPGWPDRYVCHRSWDGWLEFKKDDGRLRKIQRAVLERLDVRIPGRALVVRELEDGVGQLETHNGKVLGVFQSATRLLELLITVRDGVTLG